MRSAFRFLPIALVVACGQGVPPHPAVGDAHSVAEAVTICPSGTVIQGADVSSYQSSVDWATVATQGGLSFGIAKATEGLTIQDSEFSANWSGMKANGLIRGAYHFFHPGDDGAAQADAFLAQVGGFEAGDLPPFLDWEVMDSSTAAESITAAQNFINEIQAKTGMTTVIYTYPSFWAGLGDTSQFAGYPVWWANYTTCPDIPSPWSAWQFWQYSSTGTVPGMNCTGACDLDEFNGSVADLQAFAQASQSGCATASGSCGTGTTCCLGLTCQSGTCQAPACGDAGAGCSTDSQCCSGLTCQSGGCAAAPQCDAIWNACTQASDCCAGLACQTWTPGGSSAGLYCCDAVGASCTDSRQCCGGSLCSSSGVCLCVPQGTYCQNDADCCAGLACDATSSTCLPSTACGTTAATCSSNADCCPSLACLSGSCATPISMPDAGAASITAASTSGSVAATSSGGLVTAASSSSATSSTGSTVASTTGGSGGVVGATTRGASGTTAATVGSTTGGTGSPTSSSTGAAVAVGTTGAASTGNGLAGNPHVSPDAGTDEQAKPRGCSTGGSGLELGSLLACLALMRAKRRRES